MYFNVFVKCVFGINLFAARSVFVGSISGSVISNKKKLLLLMYL